MNALGQRLSGPPPELLGQTNDETSTTNASRESLPIGSSRLVCDRRRRVSSRRLKRPAYGRSRELDRQPTRQLPPAQQARQPRTADDGARRLQSQMAVTGARLGATKR